MGAHWITAEEAQERLGVKRQTLYAYASRGLIANRTDDDNQRRSLYAAEDVARLTLNKSQLRKGVAAPDRSAPDAAPAFSSALTTISDGRLYYLGRDACELAKTASLEDVARLMWGCEDDPFQGLPRRPLMAIGADAGARAFSLLAHRLAQDPPAHGRPPAALRAEAAALLTDLFDSVTGAVRNGALHERLARAWRLDAARADIVRQALILAVDHEVSPSTLAVRTAASTGASLAACLAAGLATLSGPLHGGMPGEAAAFLVEARRASDPFAFIRHRLEHGRAVPGFGHPAHPEGDPRARALEEALVWPEELVRIARAGQKATGLSPNFEFALAATARTLGLPLEAPTTIVITARAAGWLAHALEQQAMGARVIPRARYVGPEPNELDRRKPANDISI